MDNQGNPNERAQQTTARLVLSESTTDLTKICWTQLLREEPELVGPRRPFEPLPDDYSPENLFG